MFFFVGWPKVVPLKNSEVVDIQHNASKVWSVILTKDRISVWTFALNENILLGFLKRSDIDKYGENHFILWSYDSRKIAVITTKLCVYLYNIEEINEFVITATNHINNTNNLNINTLIPKVNKIRIIPYKLLHLMKLPPYSTITRACHLTNDVFVISTNYAQFIHIHWKGNVELTCQLNLKNKPPNSGSNDNDTDSPITPTKLKDNPNWGRPKASLPLTRTRDHENDSIGIVDLCMSSKLGIMVVVFESGSCWLIPLQKLCKNVSRHNLSVNQTTYVNEYENVTCCDICDRFHFLALGLSTGNVIIYHLNLEFIQSTERKLQFGLQLLLIFSAHKYNLIPQTFALDDVREVSWSDSGTSLAISWKKGVVVYCVRGLVIFSTLHNQVEHDKDDSVLPNENDPVTRYYPSCLKWCQKDSGFLMVTHKHEVTKDDFNHYLKQYSIEKRLKEEKSGDRLSYKCEHDAFLMHIACLKHTVGNLSQSDISKLALLADSYISIWRAVHIIDDPESTDYWSRIEIDSHYLSHNWPIRELAVNGRSDCFAIAGSTGFALYFRQTGKWRIVRSLDAENILFSCVMCWLTVDLLFIATFDPSKSSADSKWNLLCFDRWQIDNNFQSLSGIPSSAHSDIFVPQLQYPLTNHPIGMECVDGQKLLIYFVDGVIHIYDILFSEHGLSLKNYCVLAPFQTLSPHPVSIRLWNYGVNDADFCILSLSASRSLYLITVENNEFELVADNVHDFYLQRETRDKSDKVYLWTYGVRQVRRWHMEGKQGLKSLFVSGVQPHMTCIGICNTLNVLVYGRRIIRSYNTSLLYTPRFALHIDIRSYLHVTIGEKLNSVGIQHSFDFVLKAIAGGAWRCLNALEHILRSSLQKRYKIKEKQLLLDTGQGHHCNGSDLEMNDSDAALPFDEDALLLQPSLRSSYVFYANDVERDFSRQNLLAEQERTKELKAADLKKAEKKQQDLASDKSDETNSINSVNSPLMMMSSLTFDDKFNKKQLDKKQELARRQIRREEKEIDVVIKFLRKFPDYPGIVVNVARKTEPSQWNDLYSLCGSPIILIQKAIARNQLATASKYLYVFEKIRIELAIHFATLLIELAMQSSSHNLVLSLLRFSHKLKLMIKESHENNIEIPQLNVNIE